MDLVLIASRIAAVLMALLMLIAIPGLVGLWIDGIRFDLRSRRRHQRTKAARTTAGPGRRA